MSSSIFPFASRALGARRAALALLVGASLAQACGTSYDIERVRERTALLYDGPSPPPDAEDRDTAAGAAGQAPLQRQEIERGASLELYLRYGLHENAALRAAFERWRAALERIPQVSSLPDPRFSWSYFVEDIQTRTGPIRNRFNLSQTFPWFGKLGHAGEVATREAEVAWQKVAAERLRLERDIRVAFYEYANLAQAIRITEDNLRLLQRLEPVAQRKLQGGGGQDDLLRLQVEIGTFENDLQSLRALHPALSARLEAAMNWSGATPLPMPALEEPAVVREDTERLLARARDNNPDVLGQREDIEKWNERTELAGLDKWPDITLGVEYYDLGSAVVPTPGSGDDPLAVSVMFNLPIWRGRYAAAEREAERGTAASRRELDQRLFTLQADVEMEAYRLGDAARQLALYRDTLLTRARQAVQVTEASYRAGKASLLDVIDSERVLLHFEKSYWRACADYRQSEARLDALCGGDVR